MYLNKIYNYMYVVDGSNIVYKTLFVWIIGRFHTMQLAMLWTLCCGKQVKKPTQIKPFRT